MPVDQAAVDQLVAMGFVADQVTSSGLAIAAKETPIVDPHRKRTRCSIGSSVTVQGGFVSRLRNYRMKCRSLSVLPPLSWIISPTVIVILLR